ncbi:MAG: hypothetical protein ACOC5T_07410 [Elusimicrobiota bacterium]
MEKFMFKIYTEGLGEMKSYSQTRRKIDTFLSDFNLEKIERGRVKSKGSGRNITVSEIIIIRCPRETFKKLYREAVQKFERVSRFMKLKYMTDFLEEIKDGR